MRDEVVPRVEVCCLLVSMIADDLPVWSTRQLRHVSDRVIRYTPSAGQNLATQLWPFETSTFEDDGASIAVWTFAYVTEGLHVTLEMEQEF